MKLIAGALCLLSSLLTAASATAAEVTLPPGTAVSVKLTDKVDSAHDPFGKQYAAAIAAPVEIGSGHTIAAGARATVVLVHNNSGWITQLSAVTVNGRMFAVESSAGALADARPAPANRLQQIGLTPAAPRYSDGPLVLAPGTELNFRLLGRATPARSVATGRSRHPGRVSPSRSSFRPSVEEAEGGIPYLCSAKDIPDRALPTSYYIADVFETSDDQRSVEQGWRDYLAAAYPYRFGNNPRAVVHCTRLSDLAAERSARRQLERDSRSDNAEIVQTRWRYTLGPPPGTPGKSTPK